MAYPLLGNPKPQFLDTSGSPLASGTLSILDPADDTNKASYPTYDDAEAATNANDNPMTLDSYGSPSSGLWGLDGEDYKVVLKNSDGDTVWTQDDIFMPGGIKITSAEDTAGLTIVDYTKEPGNVLRYGTNTTPGTTSMATALQAAFDQAGETGGASIFVPEQILIDSQVTFTGSDATDRIYFRGDGEKSLITSTVVGEPTIEINDPTLVIIEKLRFEGNGLTGATGNGHAVALIDTVPNSGTYYPNNAIVRDCSFKNFRGNDVEITNTTTGVTTVAAGLYVGPGVANYVANCKFDTNGQGIHFDETYNSHIENCVFATNDQWGIQLDAPNDGTSISGCDFTTNGVDANGDPATYSSPLNYAAVGVLSAINPVSIKDCKLKDGQAITIFASLNVTIKDNYIRVDPPSTGSSNAIYAQTFTKLVIEDNDFEYLVEAGNTNSRSAMYLDMNANYTCAVTVRGNNFNHANNVAYDLTIIGKSTANSDIAVDICGNSFGNANNGRTTSTVTDCIVLSTGNFHGILAANTFTAVGDEDSAGGTITDCLDISNAAAETANNLLTVGNVSKAYLTGATITNSIESIARGNLAITTDGDTGGASSAGSGNQYVEMTIQGVTYKILHDGTV